MPASFHSVRQLSRALQNRIRRFEVKPKNERAEGSEKNRCFSDFCSFKIRLLWCPPQRNRDRDIPAICWFLGSEVPLSGGQTAPRVQTSYAILTIIRTGVVLIYCLRCSEYTLCYMDCQGGAESQKITYSPFTF